MRRSAPALAAALLVTLVAGALTPCVEGSVAASVRNRGQIVSAHAHGARSPHEDAVTLARDGWCHGARPPAELRALCVCGCSDRPTVAGVANGFGWALLPSPPVHAVPQAFSLLARTERAAPDSVPNPIEHVPLAA
jgi:hypothetical protein